MEKKIQVIIIEDDLLFSENVNSHLLSLSVYHVSNRFKCCEDALQSDILKQTQIVLLDIRLPGLCGLDAIPMLLRINPDLKIIMLTSFNHDEKLFTSLKMGAKGYLLKTDCFQFLETALIQVMQGGMMFSPEMAKKILRFFKRNPLSTKRLTTREKEVLKLLKNGFTKKQIAEDLKISYGTVDSHVKNIYKKLQVNNKVQAAQKASDSGII